MQKNLIKLIYILLIVLQLFLINPVANVMAQIDKGMHKPPSLIALELLQEKKPMQAKEVLQKALKKHNDLDAMFLLGQMTREGIGGKVNLDYAIKLLVKAANGGQADAQYSLGEMAINAKGGIKQDLSNAISWFELAAKNGHLVAQLRLGLMYIEGLGVKADKIKGKKYIENAANSNLADAQYHLGLLYLIGDKFKRDFEQSASWFEKASKQGHPPAQYNLALLNDKALIKNANAKIAFNLMEKAAKAGFIEAQTGLGAYYYEGKGVEKSLTKAYNSFKVAAENGEPQGQFFLAVLLAEGSGVKKDVKSAYEWVQKSIANSKKFGITNLAEQEGLAKKLASRLSNDNNALGSINSPRLRN